VCLSAVRASMNDTVLVAGCGAALHSQLVLLWLVRTAIVK
jgi:hypothetical protein